MKLVDIRSALAGAVVRVVEVCSRRLVVEAADEEGS